MHVKIWQNLNIIQFCVVFTSVKFLVLIYYYIRYCHWEKLQKEYPGLSELFCNFLWVYNCFKIKSIKQKASAENFQASILGRGHDSKNKYMDSQEIDKFIGEK